MPTPKKGARLGGSPAHQRLMLSNLATALFEHGRITTTEARARTLRPLAEKLITKAKKAELGTTESIHNRREVLKTVRDKGVVHVLFTEIGPSFAEHSKRLPDLHGVITDHERGACQSEGHAAIAVGRLSPLVGPRGQLVDGEFGGGVGHGNFLRLPLDEPFADLLHEFAGGLLVAGRVNDQYGG